MAEIPHTLQGYAAFVDGRGYAGRTEEAQLPKIALKTEDHRDGGMDAPIELAMGMEKLGDVVITFTGQEAELLDGFGRSDLPITLRGSFLDGAGVEHPDVIHVRGLCKEIDDGNWKAAEGGKRKVTLAPRYYKRTTDGRDRLEIDPVNKIRMVNGVDQLAQRRRNLGV
jgi:hypothetical protein